MVFNINDFKAQGLPRGGARPTQFKVMVFPPFASENAKRIEFMVQAASIPPFIVEPAPVAYFGRQVKYAGDRTFPDWEVQVINDEDFPLRAILEKWSNEMNAMISNRMNSDLYPIGYKQTAEVIHYGKNGLPIRSYKFNGLWPSVVGPIQLGWGQVNEIEVFPVTFTYDEHEPVNQLSAIDQYNGTLADDGRLG